MKLLRDLSFDDLNGKRVLVRADFNVPLVDGVVDQGEAFRLDRTLPTIQFLLEHNASVVIVSHLGRGSDSLAPVGLYLSEKLGNLFEFVGTPVISSDTQEKVEKLSPGHVVLLENLRHDEREENNDEIFARTLASYGDLFVQDAFAVCHRNHASLVGVPRLLPSYAGLLLQDEITHLQSAFSPKTPATLIMGGVKFETKLPLIEKLLPVYQHVVLGGGLLNTVLERKNIAIGKSVFDETADISSVLPNSKLVIPERLVVERNGAAHEVQLREVEPEDTIVDIIVDVSMQQSLMASNSVTWNGPLGWYEKGYQDSTKRILEACDPVRQSVIVGGGDTVTAIKSLGLEQSVSFLSTGGGAMLEFLEKETLPGIAALG